MQRVVVARAVAVAMVAGGLVAGYLLGCALALHQATNWLDQYLKLTAAQDNASFSEARSLLNVLKASPYSYCSEAEISYFRGLVFRSEYMKDAGRIHGGNIECSATVGRPARSIGPFTSAVQWNDGTIAYSNLAPTRDPSLKRVALQLGSAYVVLASNLPPSPEPISMEFSAAAQDTGGTQLGPGVTASPKDTEPNLDADGSGRLGNTLYATRCSTLHFNCVTVTTTVSDALHHGSGTVAGGTFAGGLLGVLCGMVFSFAYNRSRDLSQQLRRAIKRDELQVVYQPIVDLSTQNIVGAEALARWTDEEGNDVEPDVFVGIAEALGIVGGITKTVLHRALRDFAKIFHNHPAFRLSVNVAGADLVDPQFLPMLEDCLKQAKVKPENLVIEITERSAANGNEAMETIRILRSSGHSIHIDDFGTGNSNLDKLLYLFADTIKIDKAFTKVIGTESVAVAILPQILAMAKSLNLEVVVEGVETGSQADYFSPATQKIYGQGWLYGRPVTAEEFNVILGDAPSPVLTIPEPVAAFSAKPGALYIVGSRVA
jgi:sensor c-di-GMP phosphodiesterase-like protein